MAKFYFTYGSDEQFPYQGGWTEIEAEDIQRALIAFRYFHPSRSRDSVEIFNFADVYSEDRWARTVMAKTQSNLGHGCRERITVTVEKEPYYSLADVALIVEHVSYSRTIIDNE